LGVLQFGCWTLSLPDWGELGLCEKYKPFGGTAWKDKKEEKSNTSTDVFTIDDVKNYLTDEDLKNAIIMKENKPQFVFADGETTPIYKKGTDFFIKVDGFEYNIKNLK
jgi:hypothetical protein